MLEKNTLPHIFITTNHSGKMKGMVSINTSTLNNPFCTKQRKNPDIICSSCYAAKFEQYRPNTKETYTKNAEILTTRPLKPHEIPRLNHLYCRFNSYGELHNSIHFKNLVTIAEHNPQTRFALWTKRLNLVTGNIPDNFTIVYSNPHRTNPMTTIPDNADIVFNVINKKNDTEINCQNKCIDCLICYTEKNRIIYESLK